MDYGALTFTHVCVDSMLEHHRSFTPSTLVSQLETQGMVQCTCKYCALVVCVCVAQSYLNIRTCSFELSCTHYWCEYFWPDVLSLCFGITVKNDQFIMYAHALTHLILGLSFAVLLVWSDTAIELPSRRWRWLSSTGGSLSYLRLSVAMTRESWSLRNQRNSRLALAVIIKPRRMREGYGNRCVCLCVCVSVFLLPH